MLQAPLFGMLSWVNSSEVRRWLQTKIADPQTLRCTSAPQDKAFGNPISRHDSDTHLTGAQDGMPGMPLPSHHPDMAWVSMPHLQPALNLWAFECACSASANEGLLADRRTSQTPRMDSDGGLCMSCGKVCLKRLDMTLPYASGCEVDTINP